MKVDRVPVTRQRRGLDKAFDRHAHGLTEHFVTARTHCAEDLRLQEYPKTGQPGEEQLEPIGG